MLKAEIYTLLKIFSCSSDGIACIDLTGNFIFTNGSFERFLGYSKSEIKGMNANQLLSDENSFSKLKTDNLSDSDFYKENFLAKSGEKISLQIRYWKEQNNPTEAAIWLLINKTEADKKNSPYKNNFNDLNKILILTRNLQRQSAIINNCLKNLQQDLGGEIEKGKDYLSYALEVCAKIKTNLDELESSGGQSPIKAEKELKEKEIQYRNIFNNSNDAILVREDLVIIDCNKKAVELFGYSKADLMGKTPQDLSPEHQENNQKTSEAVVQKLDKVLKEKTHSFEWKYLKSDGSELDAEVFLNRFEANGKELILSIITDVTKRKKAEKELKEKEMHYRAIFNNSSDAILLFDNLNIIDCNRRAVEIFNYSKRELIGKSPADLSPEY
jgi:PAS domain S-box-containing protein